ncbi:MULTISPECIES: hypothetical protein [Pantoea]|nr:MULTISPECIES: hypothetical protein [Pantoea]UOV18353.1 hypothetical protein LZ609_18875 [Pantoea agglomerans]
MRSFSISKVDFDAGCWVVRPGKGYRYYEHFLIANVAAIGHFDEYLSSEMDLTIDNFEKIKNEYYKDQAKQGETANSIGAGINQVRKFIFDMEVGDLIFTIGPFGIVAGVIKSEAYVDEEPLVFDIKSYPQITEELPFKLRRNISWGKSYPKSSMPLAIKMSFKANQTVFSASEHIRSIYHWLNTIFIADETVYTSARINQIDDIHHYSVTKFAETLNKIEALARLIEDTDFEKNNINLDEIDSKLLELALDDDLHLTTQQAFMSPGDYWNGFNSKSKKSLVAFVLAICFLFDVSPVFADPEEAKIADQLHAPIKNVMDKMKAKNGIELVKEKLELELPEQNKKIIKDITTNHNIVFPKVRDSDSGVR